MTSTSSVLITSVTTGKSGFFAGLAQNLERLQAQALEVVGRGAWLVGSAAQHGGTRPLYRVRRVEQLRARFDGTRARDDHDLGAADRHPVYLHHRALRLHLAAHQFEGLCDGHYVVHSGSDLKRFDLVAPPTADGGDDRALRAARDVRLVSGFADAFNDMVDFLFGGFL